MKQDKARQSVPDLTQNRLSHVLWQEVLQWSLQHWWQNWHILTVESATREFWHPPPRWRAHWISPCQSPFLKSVLHQRRWKYMYCIFLDLSTCMMSLMGLVTLWVLSNHCKHKQSLNSIYTSTVLLCVKIQILEIIIFKIIASSKCNQNCRTNS